MKNKSIYKSDEGKKKILDLYESYLKTFSVKFERKFVNTRYGKTHILVTGPVDGKPIFIFQGGNCINPMTLSWFAKLLPKYRIYAPDTIGHPGYSEETRVSAKDNSFALWVADLMDYFEVKKSAFIGPSYGGGIILRLATFMPDRISCSVLVSPAGIKLGSKLSMVKEILLPLLMFTITKSNVHLGRITDRMSLNSMKENDRTIIGEIFKNVKLEQDMPKLTVAKELAAYNAPTLVIAGDKDVFFPGKKVILTASRIFSSSLVLIAYNMGHFPADDNRLNMEKDIKEFLRLNY